MEVNSDLRRSRRLQQNGYYNEDGRPCVNYYEARYRAPKRRGHTTAPPTGRGFLTRHSVILLLCAIAVGCDYCMQARTSIKEEPLKMTRDESVQSPVLDDPKMTRDESVQSPVLDKPPKMTRDESVQSPVLDKPPKMTRDESVQSPKPDGLPKFPAKAQDAKILGSRSSETYAGEGYMEKIINWFCPRYLWVLQDKQNLVPGCCWPFQAPGHLHVKLDKPVHISHVTIGHIIKAQAPKGENPSAPRLFSVYGLETSDDNETLLGQFQYDASGPAFQTFPVASALQGVFKDVRLNVENNWGHPEYTCLYNFKVHGTPVQP